MRRVVAGQTIPGIMAGMVEHHTARRRVEAIPKATIEAVVGVELQNLLNPSSWRPRHRRLLHRGLRRHPQEKPAVSKPADVCW